MFGLWSIRASPFTLPPENHPDLVEGPNISAGEEAATGLALILHERATNSAKCGS